MRHICCVALGISLAAGTGGVLAQSDQHPKKGHPPDGDVMISQVLPVDRGHPAKPPNGAPSGGSATNVPPQLPGGAAPKDSSNKGATVRVCLWALTPQLPPMARGHLLRL